MAHLILDLLVEVGDIRYDTRALRTRVLALRAKQRHQWLDATVLGDGSHVGDACALWIGREVHQCGGSKLLSLDRRLSSAFELTDEPLNRACLGDG